jgi:hypothetical protein
MIDIWLHSPYLSIHIKSKWAYLAKIDLNLKNRMESMINRWHKALQATEDIHNSRLTASRKEEQPRIKENLILT